MESTILGQTPARTPIAYVAAYVWTRAVGCKRVAILCPMHTIPPALATFLVPISKGLLMRRAWLGLYVLVALCGGSAGQGRAADRGVVHVDVDLTEAPRRILHAHLRMPVVPGPLSLYYPKWIPGEHAPNGPITDMAGLKLEAGDKTLTWRRDPADMFAFRCQVPDGASELKVALDFLEPPTQTTGFTSAASTTDKLAILSWNQVVLYPKGDIHQLQYQASARLPAGWKFGTALAVQGHEKNVVHFKPVALARLIDSPLLTGATSRKSASVPAKACRISWRLPPTLQPPSKCRTRSRPISTSWWSRRGCCSAPGIIARTGF